MTKEYQYFLSYTPLFVSGILQFVLYIGLHIEKYNRN